MRHTRGQRIVKFARLCLLGGMSTLILALVPSAPSSAQRMENAVAIFAALDKVTAKISRLEVPLNETKSFGALKVTPRVCYTRAPTEPPKTTSFVEVDEMLLDGKEKRIFTGWMFADSPGLNAVEHPVFDVWLTGCAQPRGVSSGGAASGHRAGHKTRRTDRAAAVRSEPAPPPTTALTWCRCRRRTQPRPIVGQRMYSH